MQTKFLILFLVLAATDARAQTSAIDRADSLSARFEYRAAIPLYRSVSTDDEVHRLSELATAENMLGLDVLAEGDKDSAEVLFGQAVETSEHMVETYPDAAASYFNRAAAKGNLALLKGGKTKVRLGREVESDALRAVEIDSTYSDALSVLGTFYREVAKLNWIERLVAKTLFGGLPSGSLEKSERYLRRAIKSDPASPFANYELGETLIEMERTAEATKVFEKLQTLKPRNSENVRQIDEAASWLEQHPGR